MCDYGFKKWRSRRDLNSWMAFTIIRFPSVLLRPLGHDSALRAHVSNTHPKWSLWVVRCYTMARTSLLKELREHARAFVVKNTTHHGEAMIEARVFVKCVTQTYWATLWIIGTEDHLLNSRLTKRRQAHGTRLKSYIETTIIKSPCTKFLWCFL